ncbi:hypothetical protein L6452_09663 [Arctium lappa]|uniref:Uncharacterized protein n=1 Tax=Arctium lappa TaxID=4217 RepID=A0ACB9DL02_ARCLA|nr:hypothetical protein L6452_09663 [Arctium lappa]
MWGYGTTRYQSSLLFGLPTKRFHWPIDQVFSHLILAELWDENRERFGNRLRSWKSVDDPSIGGFSVRVDTEGYPQGIQWQGKAIQFRVGPWDGLKWSGMLALKENPIFTFEFVLNRYSH